MTTTTEHPNWEPIQITRVHDDLYFVGAVQITRRDHHSGTWLAVPVGSSTPLFTAPTLEKILQMAHGAVEMMRP